MFPAVIQYVFAQKTSAGGVEDGLEGQEQAARRKQKASVPEISFTTEDLHMELCHQYRHCYFRFYLNFRHFLLTSCYPTFYVCPEDN